MLWNLFIICVGVFAHYIIVEKFKISVFSVKGISIIIIMLFVIEFVKFLITSIL